MDKFSSPEYTHSRRSYMIQCTVEYFISLLAAGAFLTRLLASVGISDALVGIISSFISLAFVIQFFTLYLVRIKVSSKKLVMLLDTISIFFFMFMYLVPFLPIGRMQKTILLMLSILLAYVCKYLVLNICFRWANSYVDPAKRARFSAVKEMISLFSGMIFTVIMGYVIDRFEGGGNLSGGLLFIAASILVLNICNFTALAFIKSDRPAEGLNKGEPTRQILRKITGNKSFRSVVVLTVLWDVARYFTIGFIGVFEYKDLMMSVLLVQVIQMAANIMRLLISGPVGRYSDKHSYAKGFKLGLYLAAAAFCINIFTTRTTWFFIVIYTVLYNCSYAGINQNSFNIVYSYVDSEHIVQAMAIKNCIGGLLGFAASVAGGKILDIVQANSNMIFGVHIYGQQILSAISFAITLTAIIYTRKVVEKQKVMIQ